MSKKFVFAALKNKKSLNINQKATLAGLEVKEITNVYLGKLLVNADQEVINVNIIEKGMRIPCSKNIKSYMNAHLLKNMIQYGTTGTTMQEITESYTATEDVSSVEVVWKKETAYPRINSYEYENNGIDYIDSFAEMSTTYSIDANQVFRVLIKHVMSGTVLVDEALSMKQGSLGGGKSVNNLNDFNID